MEFLDSRNKKAGSKYSNSTVNSITQDFWWNLRGIFALYAELRAKKKNHFKTEPVHKPYAVSRVLSNTSLCMRGGCKPQTCFYVWLTEMARFMVRFCNTSRSVWGCYETCFSLWRERERIRHTNAVMVCFLLVLFNKIYKIFHKKIQYIINCHLITRQTHPSDTYIS